MKKVAVTGSLCSGKTLALNFFKEKGAYTVSSDAIVHKLYSSDKRLQAKVVELLGHDLFENGEISRKAVAKRVFSDPILLDRLERIIHPRVFSEIQKESDLAREQKSALFVAEVPLLYEANFASFFDWVILVIADEEKIKERLIMQNLDWQSRLQRFLPNDLKQKKAHIIIENNDSFEKFSNKLENAFSQIISL